LRKIFAETAMGNYSSSPGAIYPALQRLETDGLLSGKIEETAAMRRLRLYRITATGLAALKRWLARPIAPDEVKHRSEELMLRFAFWSTCSGRRPALLSCTTLAPLSHHISPNWRHFSPFIEPKCRSRPDWRSKADFATIAAPSTGPNTHCEPSGFTGWQFQATFPLLESE
jgi:hypothetical protein